jgi:D-glycero-alpha-D-manno-heptose 1-phosphate guanylyltransferase
MLNQLTIQNKITPLIFCAGKGLRLKDLSGDIPKPLVNVIGDKKIIDFTLEYLLKNGFKDVFITYFNGEKYFLELKDRYQSKLNITLIKENEPLGQGGSILNISKSIKTKDYILGINGDTFFEIDLDNLVGIENEGLTIISDDIRNDIPKVIISDKEGNLLGFKGNSGKLFFYNSEKEADMEDIIFHNYSGILLVSRSCLLPVEYDNEFIGLFGEGDICNMLAKQGCSLKIKEVNDFKYFFTINTIDEYNKVKRDLEQI